MSNILLAAADACLGDNPYALATVTAANGQLVQIPALDRGKFWVFAAQSVDVFIRFGIDNSVQIDSTVRTTLDGAALPTSVAKAPHLWVPAGSSREYRLQAAWTHFAHISTATTGVLWFGVAQGGFGAD